MCFILSASDGSSSCSQALPGNTKGAARAPYGGGSLPHVHKETKKKTPRSKRPGRSAAYLLHAFVSDIRAKKGGHHDPTYYTHVLNHELYTKASHLTHLHSRHDCRLGRDIGFGWRRVRAGVL